MGPTSSIAATVASTESNAMGRASPVVAMKDGTIVAEGNSWQVITKQVVQDVFGLAAKEIPDPVAGAAASGAEAEGAQRERGIRSSHQLGLSLWQ
jgi:iron complex transport system ATP-binding protein